MNANLLPWGIAADDYPADGYAADQLDFMLGYAILAPSTHNTQPWLFRINAADVELHADPHRSLPVIDPLCRELVISCGAALFNLRVVAEYFGHAYSVHPWPDARHPHWLARFELGLSDETTSEDIEMFHAITRRRTTRQPFVLDPPPEATLSRLETAAQTEGAWLQCVLDEDIRNAVADLTAEADRLQWAERHFRRELATWVRSHPEEHADGLASHDVGIKDWLSFAGPALIRTFDRGGGQAARDRDIALHSPVLAVLGTDADDSRSWLAAGQALQSVLLKATAENLCVSFLNQAIEVPAIRDDLAALVGGAPSPQVLLRIGYGPNTGASPRRSVRQVLLAQEGHHHG